MIAIAPLLLCLLSALVEVHSITAPYLTIKGNNIPNNSYVEFYAEGPNIENQKSNTLQCNTDLNTCCRSAQGTDRGDWYFPDGNKLPFSGFGSVYEDRGDQLVTVYRIGNSFFISGIYRCDIETVAVNNNSGNVSLFVGLYTNGGDVTIPGGMTFTVGSDLNGGSPQFTLNCTSTGGPATTVTWARDSEAVSGGMTVLNNAVTAQYTHTLTVTGKLGGQYQCNVINNKPSTATAQFTVQVASAPTGLTAVQEGPTGIRVSWTPPTPLGDTTGYRIYCSGGSSGSEDVSGGSTHNHLRTGLRNGARFIISIVGTSVHLPSERVEYSNIINLAPGMPVVSVGTTTPSTIPLTLNTTGSVVDNYEVVWERDTLGKCSDMHKDSTTISGDFTSYTVMGLQGYSNYTITVTATNAAGSVVSDSVTGMTGEAAPTASPTIVSTSDVTKSSITVQWRPVDCIHRNGYITGYSVQYGVQGNGNQQNVYVSGGTTTETTISGMGSDTTYSIKVAAVNSAGTGMYSSPIAISTSGRGISDGNTGGGGGGGGVEAAIGGVVAALLVVAVVAVLVIVFIWWRRRKKPQQKYSPTTADEKSPPPTISSSVQYTKQDDDITYGNILAPEFKQFPEDARVLVGEGVLFQVKVTGSPPPKLVWYHNGEEVVPDYSSEIMKDGSLTMPSVEVRHTGTYKVVAENVAGKKEGEVKLYVEDEEGTTKPKQGNNKPPLKTKDIPVTKFGRHVVQNHSKNNKAFKDEYDDLYDGTAKSIAFATTPKNKMKNRFANICVYDDNSVVLDPVQGHESDYVNASYIDGYSVPKKFIATQGPLPNTIVDFWRLVWQEKSPSIVMITNLEEGCKTKCQQYWPDSGSKSFGPFCVSVTDQQIMADYTIRSLSLELTGSSERSLRVTHFHFTAWPDHGVPDYATPILTFHRRVEKEHKPSKGPMIVHCSAGVGRTGTFITINRVLERAKKEGVVDIPGVIQSIRRQRMKLVQTPGQYIFLHDAILESVTCGDTQITAGSLRSALQKLYKKDQSGSSGMDVQFATLEQVSLSASEAKCVAARSHPSRNCSEHFLPVDKWRVVLKGETPDYINASSINGYKCRRAFIITQGPMSSTARDFWKMVHERKSGVIVMLSNLQEGNENVCYQYWPGSGSQQYGEFTVELLGEERLQGFVLRSMSVQDTKSGKAQQISQFHITNWAPDGSCSNLKTVTDVIDEVSKVQRSTGNHPIVMHCSDTVSRCGMFCAIATTIERCKTEGVVDVFQVVKALRVQKPGAVRTVAQYCVIFEAVLVFLDSFETYSNF